jgi:hypothetical protein
VEDIWAGKVEQVRPLRFSLTHQEPAGGEILGCVVDDAPQAFVPAAGIARIRKFIDASPSLVLPGGGGGEALHPELWRPV